MICKNTHLCWENFRQLKSSEWFSTHKMWNALSVLLLRSSNFFPWSPTSSLMFHNSLWRAPAAANEDTSNTQRIMLCCQALEWHEQFLSIHVNEIIPANSLITGCLLQIQHSLPDTSRCAMLHSGERNNALAMRENYFSLSLCSEKDNSHRSERNGQGDLCNTCDVERRKSKKLTRPWPLG